jgi:hypothetical protein
MEHLVIFNDFTVVFLCKTLFFEFALPVLRDLRSETTLTKAETQPWSNPFPHLRDFIYYCIVNSYILSYGLSIILYHYCIIYISSNNHTIAYPLNMSS